MGAMADASRVVAGKEGAVADTQSWRLTDDRDRMDPEEIETF